MFTDDGRLVLRQVVPSEVRSCGECRSVQSCCWLQTTIGDVEIVGRLLLPVSVLVVTVTSNIGVPIIIILRKTQKEPQKKNFNLPPKKINYSSLLIRSWSPSQTRQDRKYTRLFTISPLDIAMKQAIQAPNRNIINSSNIS